MGRHKDKDKDKNKIKKKGKGKEKEGTKKTRKRSQSIFKKRSPSPSTVHALSDEDSMSELSEADSQNPFSDETSSGESPPIRSETLTDTRRISTSSYRTQRFPNTVKDAYSPNPSADDDPEEQSRLLLRQNSFQKNFPRTRSSGSTGPTTLARDHSGSSMDRRSRSTSANNISSTRGASSPSDNPFSLDDQETSDLILTVNSNKDAFTKKRTYLALKAEVDDLRDDHQALEEKLNELLRYTSRITTATNNVVRAVNQLQYAVRANIDMTADLSRGAIFESYNPKNNAANPIVQPRKSDDIRAELEEQETACCGSWANFKVAFRGFFCSCFEDPDEVEYAIV